MKNLIILIGLWISPVLLWSQDTRMNQQRLEERIETQRIAFITERVKLTPEEAQSFWPVYNEYRDKEKALRASRKPAKAIMDMDDSEASAYLDKVLGIEQQELQLKIEYSEHLKSMLSPKKILRFYTAERQFKERLVQIMSQRRERHQDRRGR